MLDVDWLMTHPEGRRLLFAFIDRPDFCRTNGSTFDTDPLQQSYENGMRDVGLRLQVLGQKSHPEMFARMVAETMNNRRLLLIAQQRDEELAKQEEEENA